MSFKETMIGFASKTKTTVVKHSPEILLATGIVAGVATVVTACAATLKVDEVLDNAKHDIDRIHDAAADPELQEQYPAEVAKKDLTRVYVRTGMAFVKLYGPSVALGALSVTSILASHGQMKKRNAALAATCAALDKAYTVYRKNVVDRFGEEVDQELLYGIKEEEVEETVVDDNGKEKTKKVKKKVATNLDASMYAFWFDERSEYWTKDPTHNKDFLISRQNYFNDILRITGKVMLIDVVKALGIDPDAEFMERCHNAGWVYDPKHTEKYIDFGLLEVNRPTVSDFLAKVERSVIVNPNCSHDIWTDLKRIEDEKRGVKYE